VLDNLTYLDDWNPNDFVELLDVWVGTDGLAYVTGVGGLMVLDVSDPTDLTLLDKFTPVGHPLKRFYTAAVNEDVDAVYCAARNDGLYIFSTFIPTDIQLMGQQALSGFTLEGLTVGDETLYGAAHTEGVLVWSLHDPLSPAFLTNITDGVEDAWRLVMKDSYLFVADGAAGLKILDASDPFAPQVVRSIPTTGPAQELAVIGDLLVVASGSGGMDVIDVTNPAEATLLGNYDSEHSVFDVSGRGDLAYLSSWNRVDIVDISDPTQPELVGWEVTPGRSMGIGAVPAAVPDLPPRPARVLGPRDPDPTKVVFVADWFSFRSYETGPPYDPDLQVFPVLLETDEVSPGTVIDTSCTATNTGGVALEVADITLVGVFSDDFEVVTKLPFTLLPGDSAEVLLRYTASEDTTVGARFDFETNDPDEIPFSVYWNAGSGLQVGDPAPDFQLTGLDGFTYRLSDYRDKIVVFAFFATW
jgi:hypothetical protein